MKKVQFGPVALEVYDSINNIPPVRESKMQYYLLSEFGIGHDFEAIRNHLNGVMMAAHQGDLVALNQECENLMLGYYTMAQEYNPKHIAWLCLIHTINGEPLVDLSEEALIEKAKWLSDQGAENYNWEPIFDELKKKLPTSLYTTSTTSEMEEELEI